MPAPRNGNIVADAFTPVLAKHTKHLSLVDVLSIGIDRIQRNFGPMKKQVEAWKVTRISDESAKLVIYRSFRASWTFPSTSLGAFMTSTSIRQPKNSLREQRGVSPTPSRARSRSSIRFPSSVRLPNSHRSSNERLLRLIDPRKARPRHEEWGGRRLFRSYFPTFFLLARH